MNERMTYRPFVLDSAKPAAIRGLEPVYRRMLLDVVECIIERYNREPEYGFVDTKIDLFTGKDLSRLVGATDVFGRDTVYSWIQSRGLEAMSEHAEWIRRLPDLDPDRKQFLIDSLRSLIERVTRRVEAVRRKNGGVMSFWFDRDGRPFTLSPSGERLPAQLDAAASYGSDSFHSKALAAAASFLTDDELGIEARRYFSRYIAHLKAGLVRSDQQPFDPKNPVVPVPNRRSHGGRMIAIGALALYARVFDDPAYVADGFEFIRYILDNHVNLNGRFPGLDELDFVEFIDPAGRPFVHEGDILCDPGHALEFVGLALKFLGVVRDRDDLTDEQRAMVWECDKVLPHLLLHVFEYGFNPVGGIYKTFALNRRKPYNSDMPWWNLPETMRAAMLAHNAASGPGVKRGCLEIVRKTSNAFLGRFVTPETYPMAYQTLNEKGEPVPVIPATPDLDPGYHTGLSIIDFLDALARA